MSPFARRAAFVALTAYAITATRAILELHAETGVSAEVRRMVTAPELAKARLEGAAAAAEFVRDAAASLGSDAMGVADPQVSARMRLMTSALYEVADAIEETLTPVRHQLGIA